jgi:hypothetical protein
MPSNGDSQSQSIWHLLKEFNSLSQDEQASRLPFCIAQNLTLKQFHGKCDRLEGGGRFRWEFKDGKAWIYELPLAQHERAAGEVIFRLQNQMGQHADGVDSSGSPRCDNNANNWSYEPDGSLTVQGGGRPGPGHADAADKARKTCSCQGSGLVTNGYKPKLWCPAGDCHQDRQERACRW